MLLFDIGALLFFTGLMWIIWFCIKRIRELVIFSTIVSLIGGLIMFISYYLVMGNQSVFDKVLENVIS